MENEKVNNGIALNETIASIDAKEFETNVIQASQNMVFNINGSKPMYISFNPSTISEKKQLYKALIQPTKKVADEVNQIIILKNIIVEMIEIVDQNTGELVTLPRVVLIDDKGDSYGCVSIGVFNSVKTLLQVFGEPSTWSEDVKIKFKNRKVANGSMLELEIL